MTDLKKDDFRTLVDEDLYRALCMFYDNQMNESCYQISTSSLKELHETGLIRYKEKSIYENERNFEVTSFGTFVVLFY